MEEKYLYIFVRQDIPIEQQIVQSSHAVFSLTTLTGLEYSVPNIIVIGVPNISALNRVLRKLEEHQILHYCWKEPDYNFGFTALATEPISGSKREVLGNYRLLKHNSGVAQFQSTGP